MCAYRHRNPCACVCASERNTRLRRIERTTGQWPHCTMYFQAKTCSNLCWLRKIWIYDVKKSRGNDRTESATFFIFNANVVLETSNMVWEGCITCEWGILFWTGLENIVYRRLVEFSENSLSLNRLKRLHLHIWKMFGYKLPYSFLPKPANSSEYI